MRLFHGTDDTGAAAAFEQHNLRGWSADNLNYIDGCEDHPFESDDQLISLTPFHSTALRYAQVAVIEIEVADEDVYQTGSDEYVMSTAADYEVINAEAVDGSAFTMDRLPESGQH